MNEQMQIPGTEPNKLEIIISLLRQADALQNTLASLEAQHTDLEKQRKHIVETLIPDAMDSVQLSEFRLADGRVVKLKTNYFPGIARNQMPQAVQWLNERGLGGIVKEDIQVQMESKQALEQANIPFAVIQSIHPSSLKALVRELKEQGKEIPENLISVHTVREATLTEPPRARRTYTQAIEETHPEI